MTPDPDAFVRVWLLMQSLPRPFHERFADDEPLRNCLPGAWPTWGDLKLLVERTPTSAIQDKVLRQAMRKARGEVKPTRRRTADASDQA